MHDIYEGIASFAEPRLLLQLSACCRHCVAPSTWQRHAERLWPHLKVPVEPKRSLSRSIEGSLTPSPWFFFPGFSWHVSCFFLRFS